MLELAYRCIPSCNKTADSLLGYTAKSPSVLTLLLDMVGCVYPIHPSNTSVLESLVLELKKLQTLQTVFQFVISPVFSQMV